jgi:hypothetical protein
MKKRQDRYLGNILLYDYLSTKRAPVLLDRNLTRALQVHRHLLGRASSHYLAKDPHDLRAIWKPPTWDALDDMVDLDKSKGCFVLDIHSIRPLKEFQNSERTEPVSKTRVLLRAKGIIQVAVFPPLSNLPCVSIPAQNATLRGTARQTDRSISIDTECITIDPKNFKYPIDQPESNDAFRMNISINMDTQSNAEELYRHLDPGLASSQDPSTRLSTTWNNILDCPKGKVLLPLRDWTGALRFGLESTMFWKANAGQSVLATYNKHLRAQARPVLFSGPQADWTPSESKFKLVFIYTNETITRSGLICPHEGCRRRKLTDIDDLRMHLDSWHDYFRYKASRQGLDDEGNEVWKFTCEVSDHRAHRADQRPSANADEPFDVRIITPAHPFDEQRYLDEGNDDYRRNSRVNKQSTTPRAALTVPISMPGPPRRKPPDEVQAMPVRDKKKYSVPEAPPGVTFFRSVSRRPLETGEYISESDDEVDDSWIKLRKSAEFTKDEILPSSAKRFLKAFDAHMWEERLQSDVHAGDSLVRFTRQHCDWVWQEGVFEPFKEKVDELLQDSIISQEVHAGCLELVEAARPNQTEEAQEISQRLSDLGVRQSSHDDLYDDPPPLQLRRSQDPDLLATSAQDRSDRTSPRRTLDKGKGKARVTDTGHLTPITADSDGDLEMREAALSTEVIRADHNQGGTAVVPYDLCLCGEDAQSSSRKSPLIACTSMVRINTPIFTDLLLTISGLHTTQLPL